MKCQFRQIGEPVRTGTFSFRLTLPHLLSSVFDVCFLNADLFPAPKKVESGRRPLPQSDSSSGSLSGSAMGSLSRSVTSATAARRAASSGVHAASGARQLQLPDATDGVFMRASEPISNRSWAGTSASCATLAPVARMNGHTGLETPLFVGTAPT